MLKSNAMAATVGAGGVAYPIWATWLTTGWSVTVAIAGGALLALAIWNKILENRKLRRDLAKK